MLEIVDTNLSGFLITNRAKMTSDFQSTLVCLFDGRAQLISRDIHIGLKGGGSLISPEVDHPSRVVCVGERVHYRRKRTIAFQVRSGDVHLWPNHSARVD